MADGIRVRVRVEGRVQGVGFRYSTRGEALKLGLAGWVRNLPDGSVEAVFEGPEDRVGAAVDWCRSGPPGARVTDHRSVREPFRGESGFEIVS